MSAQEIEEKIRQKAASVISTIDKLLQDTEGFTGGLGFDYKMKDWSAYLEQFTQLQNKMSQLYAVLYSHQAYTTLNFLLVQPTKPFIEAAPGQLFFAMDLLRTKPEPEIESEQHEIEERAKTISQSSPAVPSENKMKQLQEYCRLCDKMIKEVAVKIARQLPTKRTPRERKETNKNMRRPNADLQAMVDSTFIGTGLMSKNR
mmetsp:Transcript_28477/g.69452  ORF Transcript_28477/g.69452 Transcript_28477/m.69452 type:complete len:202 (-) Transcript_28477:88-693(-)